MAVAQIQAWQSTDGTLFLTQAAAQAYDNSQQVTAAKATVQEAISNASSVGCAPTADVPTVLAAWKALMANAQAAAAAAVLQAAAK